MFISKDEEDGLHWYEGIGLGNDEDGGLGFCEELGVVVVDVPPISIAGNGGLEPCNSNKKNNKKNHILILNYATIWGI